MRGKPPNLDDEFSSDKRAFCRWADYFMPADLPSPTCLPGLAFKGLEIAKGCRNHSRRFVPALHKRSHFFRGGETKQVVDGNPSSCGR
jgi:hypothetical protein